MEHITLPIVVLSIGFIVITIFLPVYKKYKNATTVKNHDSHMNNFVFRANLSKCQIIECLKMQNSSDSVNYEFDEDDMTLIVLGFLTRTKYKLYIDEYENFCIFHLKMQNQFSVGSGNFNRAYKINPFIVEKLCAETVSYSQYGKPN